MSKAGYVYIMSNKVRGTLYVGVTSDLVRRAHQHRTGAIDGFTSRHGLTRLVYFEVHDEMLEGIAREKRLKRWRRDWKIDLIEERNPRWDDLFDEIVG